MNFRPLVMLALLPVLARAGSVPLALRPGETFTYRVGWEIFRGAGEIKIAARAETLEGLPQLRVATTVQTRGFIHLLYPFTATGESIFDPRDGHLLATHTTSQGGHEPTRTSIVFDYAHAMASYVDYLHAERSNPALVVPPGEPADLITSLIQARAYGMKPGDRRPALVLFDNEFYPLTIVADRDEKIRTPLGEFDTVVLTPLMEKEPKGMFKRGSQVSVWISRDERRLPVKLEVKLKLGTATAMLTDYTPPAALVATLPPRAL